MELNYDWKIFQKLFYAKRKLATVHTASTSPIYLVTEQRVIISAFAEGEDLADWIGATIDEVAAEFPHRDLMLYDRDQVDQSVNSVMERPHFYDQIHQLGIDLKPQVITRSRLRTPELWGHIHFLLQAIQCWWQKIFPANYGLFIQLRDGQKLSLFLMIQRGRVSFFNEPDLSGMLADKRKLPAEVVKHLAEKYRVPVQGFSLTSAEWAEWTELRNPWPSISQALRSDRSKLAPYKWSLALLIRLRGFLGV